jgi:hypothetical protein
VAVRVLRNFFVTLPEARFRPDRGEGRADPGDSGLGSVALDGEERPEGDVPV